jgi:hypothetical protein
VAALLRVCLKKGMGVKGILQTLEDAVAGLYKAKSFQGRELDLMLLLLRMGGRSCVYAVSHALGFPSVTTVLDHVQEQPLFTPTYQFGDVGKDLESNITAAVKFIPQSPTRLVIMTIDEAAVKAKLDVVATPGGPLVVGGNTDKPDVCSSWSVQSTKDIDVRLFPAPCSPLSRLLTPCQFSLSPSPSLYPHLLPSLSHPHPPLQRIIEGVKNEDISVCTLVTVAALCDLTNGGKAHPILALGTRNMRPLDREMQLLTDIIKRYTGNPEAAKHGKLVGIGCDNDEKRRRALFDLTNQPLLPSSPLAQFMDKLPGLRLQTMEHEVVPMGDIRHGAKCLRTRILKGIVVCGVSLPPELLAKLLLEVVDGANKEVYIKSLFKPLDKMNVPAAVSLIYYISLLRPVEGSTHSALLDQPSQTKEAVSLLALFCHCTLAVLDIKDGGRGLPGSLEDLSCVAHLLVAIHDKNNGVCNFVSGQLYHFLLVMITGAYFFTANALAMQRKSGEPQLVILGNAGSQKLEDVFSLLRCTQNRILVIAELKGAFQRVFDIHGVYERHPEWRPHSNTGRGAVFGRDMKRDRVSNANFTPASAYTVDSFTPDSFLGGCWQKGQGRALSALRAAPSLFTGASAQDWAPPPWTAPTPFLFYNGSCVGLRSAGEDGEEETDALDTVAGPGDDIGRVLADEDADVPADLSPAVCPLGEVPEMEQDKPSNKVFHPDQGGYVNASGYLHKGLAGMIGSTAGRNSRLATYQLMSTAGQWVAGHGAPEVQLEVERDSIVVMAARTGSKGEAASVRAQVCMIADILFLEGSKKERALSVSDALLREPGKVRLLLRPLVGKMGAADEEGVVGLGEA